MTAEVTAGTVTINGKGPSLTGQWTLDRSGVHIHFNDFAGAGPAQLDVLNPALDTAQWPVTTATWRLQLLGQTQDKTLHVTLAAYNNKVSFAVEPTRTGTPSDIWTCTRGR